jgi:hypothetical protein
MCEETKPSPRAFLDNWRKSDLPFFKRLRVALRNEWKKIRTGQQCCGNYGEPGC